MATELTDTQADRTALEVAGQCFEITKAVNFESAHYMPDHPEGHPYRNLHGHSFRLEVTIAGEVQPGAEWVEDFSYVTDALRAVAAELDHRLLNEIEGLSKPTLERLCVWIANRLKTKLPGLRQVVVARPSLEERCALVLD
ncbi:MAG: 6-carboxytetrahydropterin synthase QueD [Pseudomonadota bacterium]